MPPELSVADVERIALLAHLELTDEEKQLFTKQLADILAYAQQVQELDTTGVPATAYVDVTHRAERSDDPVPSLGRDAALDDASEADTVGGFFKVPRVIGG